MQQVFEAETMPKDCEKYHSLSFTKTSTSSTWEDGREGGNLGYAVYIQATAYTSFVEKCLESEGICWFKLMDSKHGQWKPSKCCKLYEYLI